MAKSAGDGRGYAGFDPHRCVTYLRGRHPAKTAQAVAAETGLPARTVERWLTFDAQPSVSAFARLVAAYGAPFLAAAIPGLGWVERAASAAAHDSLTREIAALEARRAAVGRQLRGDG